MQTLECPTHAKDKRTVLDAVKGLGLQVKVVDVAQSTGLPVLKCTELLNRIAYETEGHLLVDTNGGIAYKFAPNFESHYLLSGSKNFVRRTARIAYNAMTLCLRLFTLAVFMAIRASFGILLIASVVLVIAVMVAVAVACLLRVFAMFSDSGGDAGGDIFDGASFSFDWLDGLRFWTIDWIWDWCYWPRYFVSWSPKTYIEPTRRDYSPPGSISTHDEEPQAERRSSGGNFLDNCFALLFGTADPNAGLEDERWQLLAKAIRAKSGVVIAEDLAPYVAITGRDEDWMLPILIRFNGCPEVVTSAGKLIYTFPDFMAESNWSTNLPSSTSHNTSELDQLYSNFLKRQTAQRSESSHAQSLPPFIQERKQAFAKLDTSETLAVLTFASIALGGPLALLVYAPTFAYVEMLKPVLLAISAYGAVFFLMPLARLPFVMAQNAKVETRNNSYVTAAQLLANPHAEIARDQREAARVRQSHVTGEAALVYTTEEDILVQSFQK